MDSLPHFFSAWDQDEIPIETKDLILFIDYDTLLSAPAKNPRAAKPSLQIKKLLQDVAGIPAIRAAVLSGRSLKEIKRGLGIREIIYVGNHGLEMEGPETHFVHPEARKIQSLLEKLTQRFKDALRSYRGLVVENKSLTLSLYHTGLTPAKREAAKADLLKVIMPYLKSSSVILSESKWAWEIRPPVRWHRGAAVLWLLTRLVTREENKPLPLYVGGDASDEDGFRAVQGRGYGILVSNQEEPSSEANYQLQSNREVFEFLKRIKNLKSGKSPKAKAAVSKAG